MKTGGETYSREMTHVLHAELGGVGGDCAES